MKTTKSKTRMLRQGLSTGEAAEYMGVSADTIRRWEHLGLIPMASRCANNYRVWSEDVLAEYKKVLR